MRSEEPPKLLTVKSWFSRSSSGVSFQNDLVNAAADGNSSSVSVFKEGVLESGPGFAPVRHLSMRRSRPSEEIERESGAGSPSMTSRKITPVTPLTPLRWKSNLREQLEEEKSMERSRLGMACGEEDPRGKLTARNGEEDRVAEGQQHMPAAAAHDWTKSVDELPLKALAGNVDEITNLEPTGSLDRKPSSAGDDVMTMTIEFLRARLLSERSASKAAKLRAQQLATRVFELEQKLDQACADRKKSEVAAQEVFEKLKLAESSNQGLDTAPGEVSDRSISNSIKGSPLLRSRADQEDTKYLQREMSGNEDLSRLTSHGSSVEDIEPTTKMQLPENGSKVERRRAEQDRPGMKSTLQNMAGRLQESPQIQDSKDDIESRLRSMWSKISEEMAALTEDRSEEDVVREELMRWMGQVPSILQNVIPKKLVDLSHNVVCSETESTAPKLVENCLEVSPQSLLDKSQPHATANRAALLREQFAAQENVQQEWERNYHESQRKLEHLTGDDRNANKSPRASAGHQHADHMRGLNDVAENPSFLESSHAKLAKSKSSLDLPTRPSEYSLYRSSRDHDGSYVKAGTWNRERPWGQGTGSRRPDPVHPSTTAQRPFPLEVDHLNHSRMHEERSFAPSVFQEAGHEAWPERQLAQETGLYYQDEGNRAGYLSHAERGPPQWPPTNRSEEDGLRRSQSDFRAGQHTWDDGGHRNSGPYKPGQPGYNDADGQFERDRDSGREDSYSSSHPPHTHRHRHRHRRSHSDTDDWPAVEDYGVLNQQPELNRAPGLGRRQSYSGYPAAIGSGSSRASSDKAPDSYGDRRYGDERTHGARGQRRESFPTYKADHAFGQQYSPQAGRNGLSNGEPPLSLGYGPAFDAPREGSPVQRSPKAGINKSISDVLLALQMAKANIQNGGAGAKEQRLSGEKASLKTGYGTEPFAQYMQAPRQGMPQQSSQAPSSKTLRPAKYDSHEVDFGSDRYQSESDATGGTNGDTSYADQLNVGKGIQFFFP